MISRVEATIVLCEAAGWKVDRFTHSFRAYVIVRERMRVIAPESDGYRLPEPFAPWLSLDDCAELATALRKAGRIEAVHSGESDTLTFGICFVSNSWVRQEADTEALARFKALALAVLGQEVG